MGRGRAGSGSRVAVKGFIASALDRARRAVLDAAGLFIVPAALSLLPWSITYRLLKQLAVRAPSFHAEAQVAWDVARAHLANPDERAWKMTYKLTRWIERVDTYLTLTRRTAWWLKRIDVVGEWPRADRPHLFLTYHWGAGNWVWKCLRANGFHAYFLARRPQVADLGASRVALWYGRLRSWEFSRIGSLGPLYTGGSTERMKQVFAGGSSLVGMLDLPSSASHHEAKPVVLLGQAAALPSRLIDLAQASGATVGLFSCGFDHASGRRRLRVESLPDHASADLIMTRYAAHLDARLGEASACWMMWHEARAIFVDPSDPRSRE